MEWLVQEGRRQGRRSVLFPCTDRFVEFVAAHRDRLEEQYVIPLPPNEVLASILDKRRQYRLAEQAGVPMPRTIYPQRREDVEALEPKTWPYPCILKPATPHRWVRSYQSGYKLLLARSHEELMRGYDDACQRDLDVLIQELIPGRESSIYSIYFYADRSGEVLAAGVGKKLRQFPANIGNGTLRESVVEPRVIEIGTQFIRALGFHGIGNIEFRRDPRDGEFKLMELNTRTALGEEVLIAGGLHLPYIAYRDLIGRPVIVEPGYRVGVKWWYFETDFRAFKVYRQRGELTLWTWLRSVWGAQAFAYFAWDDPRPFLVMMKNFIWKWRRGLI